jgi:hypothetical protein
MFAHRLYSIAMVVPVPTKCLGSPGMIDARPMQRVVLRKATATKSTTLDSALGPEWALIALKVLVGAARFELATPCAQGRRSHDSGMFASNRNVLVCSTKSEVCCKCPNRAHTREQRQKRVRFPYRFRTFFRTLCPTSFEVNPPRQVGSPRSWNGLNAPKELPPR